MNLSKAILLYGTILISVLVFVFLLTSLAPRIINDFQDYCEEQNLNFSNTNLLPPYNMNFTGISCFNDTQTIEMEDWLETQMAI